MKKGRKRLAYFALFLLVTAVEVCIAVFVHDKFIRPYFGDVLAVVAVYFFVRFFLPDGCRRLPLYVFLFAVCVEISQFFHLVRLLSLENNRFMRILLGGSFDWVDILCYGVGCLAVWGIEKRMQNKKMAARPS